MKSVQIILLAPFLNVAYNFFDREFYFYAVQFRSLTHLFHTLQVLLDYIKNNYPMLFSHSNI